jgi:formylglycine-generating enzyme required for sulfatase activity
VKARTPLHVAVSRNGFHEESFEVAIEPEQHERRELRLRAILGEVRLTVEPADAEVRVNGKPWTGGQPMNLPADATRIDVAREGFEPWTRTVTPRPGIPIDVRAVLKPLAPPPPPPEPPSAASALGIEMVKPPPGDVTMGSSRREQGRRSNETLRQVRITRPFAISKTEITNEAFRKFRAAHNSGAFGGQTLDAPSQPVVMVTWQDAAAFCNWLSAQEGLPPAYVEKGGTLVAADPMTTGYRLPTEAEWEFCARLGAPAGNGVFPWNGAFPPPNKAGNFADAGARTALGFGIDGYVDGFTGTAPPGKFTPLAVGPLRPRRQRRRMVPRLLFHPRRGRARRSARDRPGRTARGHAPRHPRLRLANHAHQRPPHRLPRLRGRRPRRPRLPHRPHPGRTQTMTVSKGWILFAGMAATAAALVLNNRSAQAQSASPAAPAPAPAEGAAAKTAPVAPEAPVPLQAQRNHPRRRRRRLPVRHLRSA